LEFSGRFRHLFHAPVGALGATAFCSLALASVGCGAAAILFALSAATWLSFVAVLGTALAVSLAAMVAGSLVGFLFGIPRTLQQELPSAEQTRYLANTNLEQISDWLTKILIGVGLTQITQIPRCIWSLSERLAPGLGGLPGSAGFAVSLLTFFSVSGFLWGYLWTRIYFRKVLIAAESDAVSRAELNEKIEASSAYSLAASALAMEESNVGKKMALRDALRALTQQKEHFHHRTVAILLGRLHRQLGDYAAAVEQLDQCLQLRRERGMTINGDDADLLYNKACYLNLWSKQLNGDEAQTRRNSALDALKRSIALKPENAQDAVSDHDLAEVAELAKLDADLKRFFS
jgi:tetratricopeptide (TPR) repeat protein